MKLCAALCLASCTAVTARAQADLKSNAFQNIVQPFLAKNCIACHNTKSRTADLDLDAYKSAESVLLDRARWEHILEKIESQQMPPKNSPRTDAAERQQVVKFIQTEFDRADRLGKPDPGRVTARRLNRAEYNNTTRDLLGVDIGRRRRFSADDSGYGFDNIGDALSLSPVLMEKYLKAAEKVVRAAVFGPEAPKPTVIRHKSRFSIPGRWPCPLDRSAIPPGNALVPSIRYGSASRAVSGESSLIRAVRLAIVGRRSSRVVDDSNEPNCAERTRRRGPDAES